MHANLPEFSKNGIRELDVFFNIVTEDGEPPGLVALVSNKRDILYHKGFGKQNVAKDIDMDPDSFFRIFSMTKAVTSVAVMMLFEEGLLRLDDPVSRYVPVYGNRPIFDSFNDSGSSFLTKPAEKEITIRHLLSHRSGFGYGFKSETVELLKELTGKGEHKLPLMFEPGSEFLYGPSTHVLGRVIESISGKSLDGFFKERIFEPLGMENTFYELPDCAYERLVTTHERREASLVELPNPEKLPVILRGDYGLISRAGDYARFLQMLLQVTAGDDSQLIKPATFGLMAQNQIGEINLPQDPGAMNYRSRPFPAGGRNDKFGLGFQISVDEVPDLRPKGCLSWSGIQNTFFWIDPKNEIAAVLLMQVDPYADAACIAILLGFEQAIYRNLTW
ncbi:MAG: serine hydrolase [Verrucomicrobia bacterium]|nr:serine hydrolase [Verrucomicrobiota bacterium]MDA1066667.1 serine hydrolase [Verrucomicrobiota bacterium]